MELEFSERGSLGNSRTNLVKGSHSLQRMKPTPVTVSGVSVASTFWLVSGFLLIAGLFVAAGFPQWASMSSPPASLGAKDVKIGLFYFCYTPGVDSSEAEVCSLYVYPEFKPSNLSSLATIETVDVAYLLTSSICYGFGTGLLMISMVLGIIAYCKPRIKDNSVFLVAFVIQLFGCKDLYNYIRLTLLMKLIFKFIFPMQVYSFWFH